MSVVFLFGGQSSRDPHMLDRLSAADADAGAWASKRAGSVAGETNADIQRSVLATTLGWWRLLSREGIRADASAGLSLGEYAHLVDIGALDEDDALTLVAERGRIYDAGPSGVMAAVYPIPWEDLAPLVARVQERFGPDSVGPAVFASPSQTVVAGTDEAVDAVVELAREQYVEGTRIEDRVPMHVPRFHSVVPDLSAALRSAPWREARREWWPNVTGAPCRATPETLVEQLSAHAVKPVQWVRTVDALLAAHPDAVIVEVGPRTVNRDLLTRRWHRDRAVFAVDSPDRPFPSLLEELRDVLR